MRPQHTMAWATLLGMGLVLGAGAVTAYAAEPAKVQGNAAGVDLTLELGKMSGESTYEIGGKFIGATPSESGAYHFPISKLEFPLNVTMAALSANVDITDRFSVSGRIAKNLSQDAGQLKDSDFLGYTGDNTVLDVYSTSDADLDAKTYDVKFLYKLFSRPDQSLAVGAGYLYQKFDFVASDVDQWYPSLNAAYGYDIGHDIVGGPVLTYNVTYKIPYVEIAAKARPTDSVRLAASLGYSPSVTAKDEDNHLLRSKLSKGSTDGTAILFNVEGRMDFAKNWFGTARYNYVNIDTEGKQTQTRYAATSEGAAGTIGTIDEKIKSEQSSVYLGVGHAFR